MHSCPHCYETLLHLSGPHNIMLPHLLPPRDIHHLHRVTPLNLEMLDSHSPNGLLTFAQYAEFVYM
nr:hypothetical protein Iba_chr03aCG8500 [Ipomoea batatas]GMC71979.1 hypothetical protein Iba_chr03bCG7600 [Ipomoea batatas]GMC75713.1 hypothetical protein Iba_chr03dCG7530 [Ipomoea batatas]